MSLWKDLHTPVSVREQLERLALLGFLLAFAGWAAWLGASAPHPVGAAMGAGAFIAGAFIVVACVREGGRWLDR